MNQINQNGQAIHQSGRTRLTGLASDNDAIIEAALAIERVLAAAHERGCVNAIPTLSTVSLLLRDLGRN